MTASAAVIIIGAEVLSAKVVDENGPFLLAALRERGIETRETRTIGDDIDVIARTIKDLAHHTYVFTTGGVGPTHDDVTMLGVARAFDVGVHRHPTLLGLLDRFYGARISEPHLKMAEVPVGASVDVPSGLGFVPVVRMHNVYVLPGVPSLVRRCWASIENELARDIIFTEALYFNVPESTIADHLTATQKLFADVPIGSYPRFDDAAYLVKVTFDSHQKRRVDEAIAHLRGLIDPRWLVSLS